MDFTAPKYYHKDNYFNEGYAMLKQHKLILSISIVGLLLAGLTVATSMSSQAQASSLLFGQKQAYSAVVRSDKRVVTYGKIFINNTDDTPVSKGTFTLPDDIKISNLSLYQVTLPERCTRNEDDASSSISSRTYPYYENTCTNIERGAFDFDQYSSYYIDRTSGDSQLVYKEINPTRNDKTYSFDLPDPIKSQKRGAYLVAYMAEEGYVSGSFGMYSLAFKTLKTPESVEEVRVSVDVSSDLYTKSRASNITRESSSLNITDGATSANGGVTSKSLDGLQQSIGNGGVFTKTGKALAPSETFVVNGDFADAQWKLNLWPIVGSIVGFVVLIGLTIFLMKKAQKHEVKNQEGVSHGK